MVPRAFYRCYVLAHCGAALIFICIPIFWMEKYPHKYPFFPKHGLFFNQNRLIVGKYCKLVALDGCKLQKKLLLIQGYQQFLQNCPQATFACLQPFPCLSTSTLCLFFYGWELNMMNSCYKKELSRKFLCLSKFLASSIIFGKI